jgi:hypothetical protein
MVEPRPCEATFVQGVVTAAGFAVCAGWRVGLTLLITFTLMAYALWRVEPGRRR